MLHHLFLAAFILQHLLPFIGTFVDAQSKVGAGVRVSSSCENPLLRGLLSHVWVSIACASPSSYSSFSAASSSSLYLRLRPPRFILSFPLSRSLSHYYLSMSLYISVSTSSLSARMSLLKSRDRFKADSTLRTSRAVPHPSTNRALCRFTSEVERDPVHSTRYGRQRTY